MTFNTTENLLHTEQCLPGTKLLHHGNGLLFFFHSLNLMNVLKQDTND